MNFSCNVKLMISVVHVEFANLWYRLLVQVQFLGFSD
jgi:hypothetical protein